MPEPSLASCDHRIDRNPDKREGQSPSSLVIASPSESISSVESQAETIKLHNAPGLLSSSLSNTGEDPSRLGWMAGSFEWLDAPAIKDLGFSESFGPSNETHTDSSISEGSVEGYASFADVSSLISPMAHLETIDQYSVECDASKGESEYRGTFAKTFALKPYRSARQKSFRGAIQNGNNYWALGLTVLLSVAMDVIGTGMDLWSSKLAGCRKLLELGLAKSSGPIDAGQKCALMQFNWMAAMGKTLLMGVRPLSSLKALDCIHRDEIYSEPLDDSDMAFQQQHWWANMPDFRMHLLLREATDLAVEVQKAKDSGDVATILRTMPQVGDLVQRIQGWHPDLSTVAPEYADSVVHFNCLWRQGLLCFVYHDIYHLDSNDERVQGCVESSVSSLESLSWFQACQWPIFMLAVYAKTERSRNCFEVGFVVMHATLGFSAPKSLVLVLQRIWQAADAGASKGWRDVVEKMGIELNILL
ncbi:hypothetical protein FMEXI_10231 [Fusarium mexicanum]|uniref:Transcription factor n=1 Tax=Fusarium mexicanum TaxID=751941 RepID=A0A8H5MQB3_9HYPO|nr:hypothetical protein FMEXI_10231 [Fusarium mexicanum]